MTKALTLRAYVKKRSGLPLGAKGSLANMLSRSLGASSLRTKTVNGLAAEITGQYHDLYC
ncbi:hypothetical protein [Thalassotalea maritima]|uniref:hypothetical protein n=1 Tax=Thalassotalea maritima TaxID=3242416 RepID=UPI003528C26A